MSDALIKNPGFKLFLIAGILLLILLGLSLAPQYGQTWDDVFDADTGRNALNAYLGSPAYFETHDQRYYGPAHFMLSNLAVELMEEISPGVHPVDVRNFVNYLSFISIFPALLILGRWFFDWKTSIIIVALFASQPVLFGHAFINQKDIPFMSATAWAFVIGVHVVDNLHSMVKQNDAPFVQANEHQGFRDRLTLIWKDLSLKKKSIVLLVLILLLLTLADLFIFKTSLLIAAEVLKLAYQGDAWFPFQELFNQIAQDAHKTPLDLYLEKATIIFAWVRVPVAVILSGTLMAVGSTVMNFQQNRGSFQVMISSYWPVVLAGIVLGIAGAIRVAAPYIGLLIIGYAVYKLKRNSSIILFVYLGATALTMFLLWPFLWVEPVRSILETIKVIADFPVHTVLYRGELLKSDNLPWHYIPTLIGLQFTLPVVLLWALTPVSLLSFRLSMTKRIKLFQVILWGVVPTLALIILGTPLYGNFRQLLFLIPPVFVLIGFPIQAILKRCNAWISTLFFIGLMIPGVMGIIRLHPYEYTYYNAFVGGPGSVTGEFEQDYWCTAYRAAAEYLNQSVEINSEVVVAGPDVALSDFTRADIRVVPDWGEKHNPEYAVACDQAILNGFYSGWPIIHRVNRMGADFALIRAKSQ